MKKVIINNIEYNIPTGYSEITTQQMINISDIDSGITETNHLIKSLSIYCNIPEDIIRHAPLSIINEVLFYLSFLKEKLPDEPIFEFDFKDKHYSVIPILQKSEFQDFVSIESALENHKNKQYKALPYIAAILSRTSTGETIDNYNIEERAKLFEELPITITNSLNLFFCKVEELYSKLSVLSSQIEMMKVLLEEEPENIVNRVDGG